MARQTTAPNISSLSSCIGLQIIHLIRGSRFVTSGSHCAREFYIIKCRVVSHIAQVVCITTASSTVVVVKRVIIVKVCCNCFSV